MKIKVLKLITLACAALMMVSAPAAKSQTRTIGWLKDYKFDVQPDGSVKYTIEGGTDKHNYMVYLVPISNMQQRVDSAIVSPISGTFKMQGTVAKQGVYYVIYNDKIDVARGRIFRSNFSTIHLYRACRKKRRGILARVRLKVRPMVWYMSIIRPTQCIPSMLLPLTLLAGSASM